MPRQLVVAWRQPCTLGLENVLDGCDGVPGGVASSGCRSKHVDEHGPSLVCVIQRRLRLPYCPCWGPATCTTNLHSLQIHHTPGVTRPSSSMMLSMLGRQCARTVKPWNTHAASSLQWINQSGEFMWLQPAQCAGQFGGYRQGNRPAKQMNPHCKHIWKQTRHAAGLHKQTCMVARHATRTV